MQSIQKLSQRIEREKKDSLVINKMQSPRNKTAVKTIIEVQNRKREVLNRAIDHSQAYG